MKRIFIVNPVAGGRDAGVELERRLPQAAAAAGLAAEEYTIVRTEYAGHAKQLAEQYACGGERVQLFSVGGDGTLNEVLSGAYPYKNAAVGCLPYGSGNDFLRNFGTREEFLDLAGQLTGGEQEIDLFETEFGIGAAICSAGLDAQIAYEIPKFRRLPLCGGETAYRLSILQQLLGPLGRRLRITLDGQAVSRECLMVALCNGGYYGGGFFAAPECRMDDGLLDVMLVHKIGLMRIARVLPLYQKGLHIQNGEVIPALRDVIEFRRCRTAQISAEDSTARPLIVNVDGECRPAQGISARVLPLAGRIVLPAAVYARQTAPACK